MWQRKEKKFKPSKIFSQIIVLQLTFYLLVSCFLFIFLVDFELNLLFDPRRLDFSYGVGWAPIIAFLLVSIPEAYILHKTVARAKKCLDFTTTIYFVHFILCCTFVEFPRNWDWWAVNGVSLIIMALLSEFLCARVELQDINLTFQETEVEPLTENV